MRWIAVLLMMSATNAVAQTPQDEWDLEDGYQTQLLYLHALVNYAWDGEWQFDFERRQLSENALRVNTGSVSSDQLLTDVDINLNVDLNEQWRFLGRFTRQGFRRQPVREDILLLGMEWLAFGSSGFYLAANPEFNKAFIDVAAGYTFYGSDREHYLRVGVLAEDINWGSKNQVGGTQEQGPLKLTWTLRWPMPNEWWLYSEAEIGSGYERSFVDESLSPDLATQDRRDNDAIVKLSRQQDNRFWSVSIEHFNFEESATYRAPEFDYIYSNTQTNLGVEHICVFDDRHRWRFLAQFVDQRAESDGFRAHEFRRRDWLGGVFYERLYARSAWSVAYAFGQPDIDYEALGGQPGYSSKDYTDKLIVGWQFDFSPDARFRFTLSHEVSEQGFGGGAVQYQMIF